VGEEFPDQVSMCLDVWFSHYALNTDKCAGQSSISVIHPENRHNSIWLGLYAKGQPDCQSDYVVRRSNIFRRPNPGYALSMALWCPVGQVVFSGCAVLGGRNVGD
jgi:hypothetical protein